MVDPQTTQDFSDVLNDSIGLEQNSGPCRIKSSGSAIPSPGDTSKDVRQASTATNQASSVERFRGRSEITDSITTPEQFLTSFPTESLLGDKVKTPTTSNTCQTIGTLGSKLLNDTERLGREPSSDLNDVIRSGSPGFAGITSALATVANQSTATLNIPKISASPSTGDHDQISTGCVRSEPSAKNAADQILNTQVMRGDQADDAYAATSNVETTAFSVVLTPIMAAGKNISQPEARKGHASVAPSDKEWPARTGIQEIKPEPTDARFSSHFESDESDLGPSFDGSFRSDVSGHNASSPGVSQNYPTLRKAEISSQPDSGMNTAKLPRQDAIGAATGTVTQDNSALISNSPMSSSKLIQSMESHEMHVPNAPKTDLTVRIEGDAGQSVNVRVAERAGQIQVLVRANDPATAALLRREIPALQTGLERIGWHADPISNAIQQGDRARQGDGQADIHNQDAERNSPSDSRQDPGRPRSSAADQWLELMHRDN